MTVTDRTAATEQEFRARIAAFESAPTPPEVREAAVLEEVARAIHDDWCVQGCAIGIPESDYRAARAAVVAYRAQDGGAEETVRRVEAEVETWTDAAIEWYGEHRYDDAGTTYACGFEDGWNHAEERLRAALAPQAGDGAR